MMQVKKGYIIKDSERYPIVYLGKMLLQREQHFATEEQKCCVIVRAIHRLCKYLYGKEFIIESAHRALRWLKTMKSKNPRLVRWSLVFQEYRYYVCYIPGKDDKMADFLSRQS